MAKKKKKSKKNKAKKKNSFSLNFKTILIFIVIAAAIIMFMPSAILLIVGMMPTLAAYLTDKRPGKNKTFTIGAINFAGCFYYLMNIWSHAEPMEVAVDYLRDPVTVIVIYSAAGMGYIINYFATITIASILKQKSMIRLDKLEEEKKKLEERWGKKVNGERPMDSNGFLLDSYAYHEDDD